MKRIDVVNDAIAYYWGKPERMGNNEDGNPAYLSDDKTKCCAIGRIIGKDLAGSLNQKLGLVDNSIWDQMPPKVMALGRGFLMALQDVHDGAYITNRDEYHLKSMLEPYIDVSQLKYPD